jgi:hypothetical protein
VWENSFFLSKGKRENAKERKERENDGRKVIIQLQSPLMSSESPFLTFTESIKMEHLYLHSFS